MEKGKWLLAVLTLFLLCSCGRTVPEEQVESHAVPDAVIQTEAVTATEAAPETQPPSETTLPEEGEHSIMCIEPRDEDFVCIRDYIPSLTVELKYATEDNFTQQIIYGFQEGYLRYGTVKKLAAVSEELAQQGFLLKLWDGFRPVSAQFDLWEICPDSTYVANPNKGFSSHSRGNTVDITLVDENGVELEMPTSFDDFSAMADRDYSDCTAAAAENARLLEKTMEKHGFTGYWGEWWHFSDTVKYDVETCFDPAVISQWYAECEQFITLRSAPDVTAPEILKIPAGEKMVLLGYREGFALVHYQQRRGYVNLDYIRKAEE